MITREEELVTIRTGGDGRSLHGAASWYVRNKYGKDAVTIVGIVFANQRDDGLPVMKVTFDLDHELAEV